MKVQQLIYTSVLYSLSDVSKGLVNQPGYRIYSCSEKLTREEINEAVRFAGYKLPKSLADKEYSQVPSDPEVPEQFPKVYRSFKLSNGKQAIVQSSFAGVDYQGQRGNFFSHMFIIEDPPAGFRPEEYIGSPDFRTYLTEKEVYRQIVKYLPELDSIRKRPEFSAVVEEFISGHKDELSYLWERYMTALTKGKNLCICAATVSDAQLYVMALKSLLPSEIPSGFSTFNIYIPSEKHREINLHATVSGQNNITAESIKMHRSCIWADMTGTDFSGTLPQLAVDTPIKRLHEIYAKYKFDTAQKLAAYLDTLDGVSGVGARLVKLHSICGDEVFRDRALELYDNLGSEELSAVRFDIICCMYERLTLFGDKAGDISARFLKTAYEKMCIGDDFNAEPYFSDDMAAERGKYVKNSINDIFAVMDRYKKTLGPSNKLMLLRSLSLMKQSSWAGTWKEFAGSEKNLSFLVQMAADVVIQHGTPVTFTAPAVWTKQEICEMIAYFHAGTELDAVKAACANFILADRSLNWEKYGVEFTSRLKTEREEKAFFNTLRRRLRDVGYTPYTGNTYLSLRQEIEEEYAKGATPSLFDRLMLAYYAWLDAPPPEKYNTAAELRRLLLEIKKEQKTLYDFLIPKLALEIMDSPGERQEEIIDAQTMCPSFWNWFLIGYRRNCADPIKENVYSHVYLANRRQLASVPNRRALRREFSHAVKAEHEEYYDREQTEGKGQDDDE